MRAGQLTPKEPLLRKDALHSSSNHKFLLIVFFLSSCVYFSFIASVDVHLETPVGTRKLWNLLKTVPVRDIMHTPRYWSEYYCHASRGIKLQTEISEPLCKGEQHTCALAILIFENFRDIYRPKTSSKEPEVSPSFEYNVFQIDNTKRRVTKADGVLFVDKISDHMKEAAKSKHHMMWLIEVVPDHAFILEQSPAGFRLYQSWMSGFDINFWLSESNEETPCYKEHWGRFDEFKFDAEAVVESARMEDLLTLHSAKSRYGSHQIFGEDVFNEILTKLMYGFEMLDDFQLEKMTFLHKESEKHDIINKKHLWSLKHIFGLEPIGLMHLATPRFGLFYRLRVHALNLGTAEEMEQIEINEKEFDYLNKPFSDEQRYLEPSAPIIRMKKLAPKRTDKADLQPHKPIIPRPQK